MSISSPLKTLTESEIAWLAGLLEGEGTFFMVYRPYAYPMIQVSMTDRDIIARVAKLFGNNVHKGGKPQQVHHKQQYGAHLNGSRAAEIMRLIRPWLGERRGAKVDQLLAEYEVQDSFQVRARNAALIREQRHREFPTKRIRGVCQAKDGKRWRTYAMINGKSYAFGVFDTQEEAELAVIEGRKRVREKEISK